MTTISIIILNWNTAELLQACLQSLQNHLSLDHEIIVVDNASSDNSVDMVRHHFPQVRLLPQDKNHGFSQGNNIGLAAAKGEYLLCLNPDTEIYARAIEPFIAWMTDHPQTGIVGPTLWNPDGSLQRSTVPLPTLWLEFLRQTMLYRILPTKEQRQTYQNKQQQVGMVTGAALCMRRACYEQIGGFDPQIFMYYEDTDLCKRAWDAGWEVQFVPTSGIMHIKSASSTRFARTRTLVDSQKSTVYYFQKHDGNNAVRMLRGVALFGCTVRILFGLFNWLIGRNRPDQQARLRAYATIVIWAIRGRW